MSCGTKITGHYDGFFEREEVAEKLERDGEFRLAERVKRGECLSYSDLRQAENSLDRQGMRRDWDYKEQRCYCEDEET